MIYAIGDVHGMIGELKRVIASVRRDAMSFGIDRPRTLFIGDYVDRGPDSKSVITVLCSDQMREYLDPVFLYGNHDMAMLTVLTGASPEPWLEMGGDETVASYGVDPHLSPSLVSDHFRRSVPGSHARFLASLKFFHEEEGCYFSHAGIDPELPFPKQTKDTLLYGNPNFRLHRGEYGKLVVHGHWPSRDIVVKPYRIGIDTGCGIPDGKLSAIAIQDGRCRTVA